MISSDLVKDLRPCSHHGVGWRSVMFRWDGQLQIVP